MCEHHDSHARMTKWLMRAALLLIVFALGFMMGELHTMVRGYRFMGPLYGGVMMDTRVAGPDMMDWNDTPGTSTGQEAAQ